MEKVLKIVRQPANAFGFGAILFASGLVTRSCVAASDGILMPLCNGESVLLQTGQAGMVHCAGCYVALAGFLAMIGSAAWAGSRRYLS